MKNIINLTKVLLKNNFASKAKTKGKVGSFIIYFLLIAYFAGMMIIFSIAGISALQEINQQGIFISLCLTVSVLISFIRGIFTSVNVLYFSKDTDYLLPLPINPKHILIAKINTLLIYEYIIGVFLSLIPMTVYGILENFGILYYFQMIILFVLLPIFPIFISSFIIILIMRFTKIIKNKDTIQYIAVGIAMLLVVTIQGLSGGASNSSDDLTSAELAAMLSETNGIIEMYSDKTLVIPTAVNSIINFGNINGVKNFSIFCIEIILIYIVMAEISSRIYIRGLVGVTSGAGKKVREKKLKNYIFKKESIGKAYIIKEFKILFRNPVYFMQCVMPSIMFPVLMTIPFALNINNLEALDLAELSQIIKFINTSFGVSMIMLVIEFFFIFNFVSLTAISRDGGNAIFSKYIPVPLHKQCFYKIMPNIIFNMIPLIYVMTISIFVLKLRLVLALGIFVFAILINILQSYLMILIDLNKPKLEWTTEYAVVKQNMNMLYQMLFGTGIIILIAISVNTIQNLKLFFALGIAILLICVYIVKSYIKKNEYKLFKKII